MRREVLMSHARYGTDAGRARDGPARRPRPRVLRDRRLPHASDLPRPPHDAGRPEAVRQRIVAEPRRLAFREHRDPCAGRGDRHRGRPALRGSIAVPERPSPGPPRRGRIRRCDADHRPTARRCPAERPMPLRRPVERQAARPEPCLAARPRRRDRRLRLRHAICAGPTPPRREVLPRSPGSQCRPSHPPDHEPTHERDHPIELLRDEVLVPGLAGREGTFRTVHAPRRHGDVPPSERPRGRRALGRILPHGRPRVFPPSRTLRYQSRHARRERLDPARVSGDPSRAAAGTVVERRLAGVRSGCPSWLPRRSESAGTDRRVPVYLLPARLPRELTFVVRVPRLVRDLRNSTGSPSRLVVRSPRVPTPPGPPGRS